MAIVKAKAAEETTTLCIGDYCHAHRWSDKDPLDPFAVGYLSEISISKGGVYFKLSGRDVSPRWFKYCEKITPEEGQRLLARNP